MYKAFLLMMIVFWNVALCTLVATATITAQEAAGTSETSTYV
jgi:hypothetical protein